MKTTPESRAAIRKRCLQIVDPLDDVKNLMLDFEALWAFAAHMIIVHEDRTPEMAGRMLESIDPEGYLSHLPEEEALAVLERMIPPIPQKTKESLDRLREKAPCDSSDWVRENGCDCPEAPYGSEGKEAGDG